MAKSGNTWQKKLMAKSKRNWMRQNLGTCERLSPRGFNHGLQFGIVEKRVPAAIIQGGKQPALKAPHKPSWGRWKHYH